MSITLLWVYDDEAGSLQQVDYVMIEEEDKLDQPLLDS